MSNSFTGWCIKLKPGKWRRIRVNRMIKKTRKSPQKNNWNIKKKNEISKQNIIRIGMKTATNSGNFQERTLE